MSGTELAKAYVQIVPSAKGIQGSISKVLNNESTSAGKSSGLNIASAIKNAIIAAGIGKVIGSALNEGSALQQSLGGVETLFKDNANKVIKYANEAYKTAGLSANDYMQTVTGFSASLLQGLGGDTNKAADIANMALIDMSDNANKFGTSMESIQYAYQGFAKQNYTMLDNLKLGYGGTKTEMQRLLKDATALTGVQYDISNLSDVYSAINVIQTELGVTGTTAKEASSTFSGSFSSMKSSLKNFLGSLALGENVESSLTALSQSTATFLFNNFIPMIGNIIKSIPTLITTFVNESIPLIKENGLTFINSIKSGMTESFPNLLQSGVEIINNIVNGIITNLPSIIVGAGNIISGLLNTIYSMIPSLLQAGWDILQNLVMGIINNLPAIIGAAFNLISNIATTIGNNLPMIFQKGIEILGQITAGLINAIPTLLGKIPGIFENIKGEFTRHDWLSIGINIIKGIANGIGNAVGLIVDAAKNAAKSAFEAAKNFLGIESPSRKFMYLGNMTGEGFVKGLNQKSKIIEDTIKNITDVNANSLESELSLKVRNNPLNLETFNPSNNGYNQTIIVNSPTQLNPSEVARQARNATRQMALNMNVG